jgi:L-lactate dehydrogenase complex protein LldG
VGISEFESLIAKNGNFMVSNGIAAGRRLSIYLHIHSVIAYTSKLVLALKNGFKLLKKSILKVCQV